MRSGLTVVLLLAAALGVAGSRTDACAATDVAPRLLAALLEQPAGVLTPAKLALPPAGRLLPLWTSAAAVAVLQPCAEQPPVLPHRAAAALPADTLPPDSPALTPRNPRAP